MLADSTCSRNPLYMYSYKSSHSDVTFIMRYWSEIEINVINLKYLFHLLLKECLILIGFYSFMYLFYALS